MLPAETLLVPLLPLLHADPRIKAAWLEGSLGRQQADRHSDLDLHLWLDPADHPAFLRDLDDWLGCLGEVVSIQRLPGGFMTVAQVLTAHDALVALDVFLEQRPTITLVQGRSLLLYDRDQRVQQHEAVPPTVEALRSELEVAVRYFWRLFAMLPTIERDAVLPSVARLSYLAAQLMRVCSLGRGRLPDVGENRGHELLTPEERQALEAALTVPVLSKQALVDAHDRLADLMRWKGRDAAQRLGAVYPERQEEVVLTQVRREVEALGLRMRSGGQ